MAAWPSWADVPGGVWISFAIFWLVQVWIIVYGLEGIRKLESWSAPLLLAGGALLLVWAIRRGGGLGHILAESGRLQTMKTPFWQLFPAALTANVGYWATLSLNIPDFTRYARNQRSQALGQALGLPATMTAFAWSTPAFLLSPRRSAGHSSTSTVPSSEVNARAASSVSRPREAAADSSTSFKRTPRLAADRSSSTRSSCRNAA